jgi:hypothetical protein
VVCVGMLRTACFNQKPKIAASDKYSSLLLKRLCYASTGYITSILNLYWRHDSENNDTLDDGIYLNWLNSTLRISGT